MRSFHLTLLLAVSLAACSRDEDKTAEWTGRIKTGRPLDRARAALQLWNETRKVEPGLRTLLDDAASMDIQKQRAAALMLPQAKSIPTDIIDWVLRSRHGWSALATLGAIGPQAAKGLPTVRAAMSESDPTIRITAIWALFRITGKPDESVSLLLAEMEQANVGLRRTLSDQLLGIGAVHPERFTELLNAANTPVSEALLALHRKRQAQ